MIRRLFVLDFHAFQTVLVELLLISKSDIVLTSPRSSFSAIAAAAGGLSVQRVGE